MSKRTDRLRAQRNVQRAVTSRACGTCNACCIVLGVEEINKSDNEPCVHLASKGCAIYAERPKSCRDYHCLWRGGMLEGADRPDRLGVVFDAVNDEEDVIIAREFLPGALDRVRDQITRLSRNLVVVLVKKGEMRRAIGPADRVAHYMERARKRLPLAGDTS